MIFFCKNTCRQNVLTTKHTVTDEKFMKSYIQTSKQRTYASSSRLFFDRKTGRDSLGEVGFGPENRKRYFRLSGHILHEYPNYCQKREDFIYFNRIIHVQLGNDNTGSGDGPSQPKFLFFKLGRVFTAIQILRLFHAIRELRFSPYFLSLRSVCVCVCVFFLFGLSTTCPQHFMHTLFVHTFVGIQAFFRFCLF